MFEKVIPLALLALSAAAAQAEAETAPKTTTAPTIETIDVRKGDQWTYEVRDNITDTLKFTSTYAIVSVTDKEIDARLRTKAAVTNTENTTLEVFDRRWRTTESWRGTYKPYQSNSGIPEDLTIGKQWTYEYDFRGTNVATTTWTGHGEVQAWEKVTLPSGQSFDAFRIEFYETVAKTSNTIVVLGGGQNTRRTEFRIVEWYAPMVNRSVERLFETRQDGKLYDSSSEVLIGYSRADTRPSSAN